MPILKRIRRYSAEIDAFRLPNNYKWKDFIKGVNAFDIDNLFLFFYYYFDRLLIANKY